MRASEVSRRWRYPAAYRSSEEKGGGGGGSENNSRIVNGVYVPRDLDCQRIKTLGANDEDMGRGASEQPPETQDVQESSLIERIVIDWVRHRGRRKGRGGRGR